MAINFKFNEFILNQIELSASCLNLIWSSRFNHRVRTFLLALASDLDFETIKIKFTNSHETRMGLVLLVWRNVVYTM